MSAKMDEPEEFFGSIEDAEAFAKEAFRKASEYLQRGNALAAENTTLRAKLARAQDEEGSLLGALAGFVSGLVDRRHVQDALSRRVSNETYAERYGLSRRIAAKNRKLWIGLYHRHPVVFGGIIDEEDVRC